MKYSLMILLLLQSCIIIPVPPHRESGRVFITPEMIEFIKPNITKREDVLLKLGEPNGVALHEKVLIYQWLVTKAFVAVYGGGGGDITLSNYFIVSFNNNNTVKKMEIVKHEISKRKKPMIEYIKEWNNDTTSMACNSLKISIAVCGFLVDNYRI
jgi:hypothetical protein